MSRRALGGRATAAGGAHGSLAQVTRSPGWETPYPTGPTWPWWKPCPALVSTAGRCRSQPSTVCAQPGVQLVLAAAVFSNFRTPDVGPRRADCVRGCRRAPFDRWQLTAFRNTSAKESTRDLAHCVWAVDFNSPTDQLNTAVYPPEPECRYPPTPQLPHLTVPRPHRRHPPQHLLQHTTYVCPPPPLWCCVEGGSCLASSLPGGIHGNSEWVLRLTGPFDAGLRATAMLCP